MAELNITIDGRIVSCTEGMTVLEAATTAEIYIPRLCHHPDLPCARDVILAESVHQGELVLSGERPGEKATEKAHCNLCMVAVVGQDAPVHACGTTVTADMVVSIDTDEVVRMRKAGLSKILSDHPHACLTCAQKQGCSRVDCSSNVPIDERCCTLLGNCELEKVADYIGIPGDTPKYTPKRQPVVRDEPLIERDFNLCIGCLRCVRVCHDVREADVLGAIWKDDRAWVGTLTGEGLLESECRFCSACVEVCPTGALMDKDVAKYHDGKAPCVGSCPLEIDIPRYVRLIALGQYQQALELIRTRTPFPTILGYVCFHPCEESCRRGALDQPVSICALKRYVAEAEGDRGRLPINKKPDTGKKVTIIGSGPTGLTAAYYLGAAGHQVEIIDDGEAPGGMLRYAIPDYRLPPEVLERELMVLHELGVEFRLNCRLGRDTTLSELKSQTDAVMIAVGTSASKSLALENAAAEGVYPGLEFLKSAKLTHEPHLAGPTVVVGGGNVAIDAAMSALRLGGGPVHLVCLESRSEMPAHDWEIEQAEEEGVIINCSWGPKQFTAQTGKVTGVDLVRCTKVFDAQGRFSPEFDENKTEHIDAEAVVVTIGQEVSAEWLDASDDIKRGPGGSITVNTNHSVGLEGVFAAGDVVKGPSSVVDAIAAGRRVAEEIDAYLGGSGWEDTLAETALADNPTLDASASAMRQIRQYGETVDPTERSASFDLIERTYTRELATTEAARCLCCHLRSQISPVVLPPELWHALNADEVAIVPQTEGVFQLLDSDKKVIGITGTVNLHHSLCEKLEDPREAKFFVFEEDPMFTKLESELIQQHLQKHGELPAGDDLDDLF